jgi:hypothetical protein
MVEWTHQDYFVPIVFYAQRFSLAIVNVIDEDKPPFPIIRSKLDYLSVLFPDTTTNILFKLRNHPPSLIEIRKPSENKAVRKHFFGGNQSQVEMVGDGKFSTGGISTLEC